MNIIGTDSSDILIGTADADVINGRGGRDWIRGRGGDDSIGGDAGNDALSGGTGQDTLTGGEGDDFLSGDAGDDSIDGGGGTDTAVYVGALGGVSADLASGLVSGAAGNDTLAGIEDLVGSPFVDVLAGDAAANHLDGAAGNDLLEGRAGDDTLAGGTGDDTVDGGAGVDRASYDGARGPVTVNLQAGTASGFAGQDALLSIEQAEGSAFADLLIGTDGGNETLLGGAGEDTLHGGRGEDSLDGGTHDPQLGWDWVSYLSASAAVNVNLATGIASGAAGNDTLARIEGVMGTAFADTLTGDGLDNVLRGNGGNDTIDGAGGTGDWVDYSTAAGAVTASLVTGTSTGADGNDVFTGIERIGGSQFGDVLTGDAGDNRLQGNGGNDTLIGGAGSDGVDYKDASGAVTVHLGQGLATGADGSDTLVGIENVHGSSGFGDSLRGDDGANIIEGRGGNDVIDGAQGLDVAVFSGRFAQYRIAVEVGNFDLVVIGPDGIDRLNNVEVLKFDDRIFVVRQGGSIADRLDGTAAGDLLRGRDGNDEMLGGDGDDAVYGDEGTDTLDGGSGDDLLDGGTGADTMAGGAGNDTYVVDTLGDVLQESEAAAPLARPAAPDAVPLDIGTQIDTVIASITYTLGSFVENLTLAAGAGDLMGTGNTLGNELEGNEGDNVLEGGAGDDTLTGGEGIDTAVYGGQRGEYVLSVEETGGFRLQGPAADGTDIVDVERLRFADMSIALDLEGNAGTVAKFLGAVFGASAVGNADYAGIGLDLADGGMASEALMQLALDARLGAGASNADVVTLLYTNVIGVAPDEAALALYVGLIEDGTYTQQSLGLLAAESSFNLANIDFTGLTETGLAYL